ncbi:MAG: 4Fe-4S binding protein [Candidatus Omnitrophica bacterium]|nr:4Fe-4S binding protein [Candidatus Omnitrophota bacterium]MDD5488221.1 4Fe-4S binding protein [Candidatus Omnitrophota bacterium]
MKRRGRVKIDAEKCKGCVLCVDVCPNGVLALSDKVNKKGMQYVVVEHPEKCTGCGLCAIMCPDCGIEIEIEKDSAKRGK